MASAFSAIRGQDQAVGRLRALLAEGRVPHALLFSGPVGGGKSEAARALTQALQCRQAGDDGCGHCEPCRKVLLGKHPDVVTLRVAEGKTRLTIDQVRGLQGSLAYRPFEGRHRVILLPDAEALTEEAANALLKTLEEPPELTHFILTSSQPQALLDTIRSRCQLVRFAPLSREVVAQRLAQEASLPLAEADVLAGLSEGSLGRALALHERGVLAGRRELLLAVSQLSLLAPEPLLKLSEAWGRDKEEIADRLDLLLSWYRDLLVLASGGTADLLIHRDLLQDPRNHPAPPLSVAEGKRCLSLLLKAREAVVERNANVRLALERLFLGLIARGG